MRSAIVITAVAACGVVAACAAQGPQATQEQITRAGTFIEAAEKAQAQRYAAADLQRARDELRSAQAANSKGSYDAARSDAESAAADAHLASARASAGEAIHAAREAREGNTALQEESVRGTGNSGDNPTVPNSSLRAYPPASPASGVPTPDRSSPEPQTNPQ